MNEWMNEWTNCRTESQPVTDSIVQHVEVISEDVDLTVSGDYINDVLLNWLSSRLSFKLLFNINIYLLTCVSDALWKWKIIITFIIIIILFFNPQ